MAAYAATVTLNQRVPIKLPGGIGMVTGKVDVTNYNQTLAEITGITKFFRAAPTVILGGVSDSGFHGRWDATAKAVKVYTGDNDNAADGPSVQAASDVDAGEFDFVAFGASR